MFVDIAKIIVRRLPGLLIVIIGVTMITFSISHLIPTDVARLIAGDQASDAVLSAIRSDLGLDKSLPEQYAIYVRHLFAGDLGISIRTGQPVLQELLHLFPATIELALVALLLIITLAIPLGVLSAYHRDGWIDQVIRLFAIVGISTPTFWFGLLLIQLMYGAWNWFPSGGRIDLAFASVPRTTGLLLIDTLLAGNFAAFIDAAKHLVLPALTLSIHSIGSASRLIRASMIEALSEDCVRTARAAGLTEYRVVIHYGLRNAMIPFVTSLGLSLAQLLGGAVVTEIIFNWPGIGSHTMEAIAGLDFPTIMGFTLLASFVYVIANLLVDLSYLWLDPRIRGQI